MNDATFLVFELLTLVYISFYSVELAEFSVSPYSACLCVVPRGGHWS